MTESEESSERVFTVQHNCYIRITYFPRLESGVSSALAVEDSESNTAAVRSSQQTISLTICTTHQLGGEILADTEKSTLQTDVILFTYIHHNKILFIKDNGTVWKVTRPERAGQ